MIYYDGKPYFNKIKGENEEAVEGSYDPENYNDEDLFMILFKDMVAK